MRAVVCQASELEVVELPDPEPARGQVLLSVSRCGICGSDLHARYHADQQADILAEAGYDGFMRSDQRVVFGHEFCGEVVGYGPGTKRKVPIGAQAVALPLRRADGDMQAIGLSAAAPGAYAEQVLVEESLMFALPDGLSPDLGVLTEPMAIGWHAVRRSEVKKGDVAIVIGCGPVGLAVICMLKAKGVKTVVASDFAAGRRKLASACGADVVVDPSQDSPYEAAGDRGHLKTVPEAAELAVGTIEKLERLPVPWYHVWRAAETLGAKPARPVIFECVGVPGILDGVIAGAPLFSRVVVVGVCMEPDVIRPAMAINKEIDLRFVVGYTPLEFRDTLQMLAEGKVDASPIATGTVGLAGVETAFEALAEPETHAKIVIDPSSAAEQIEARAGEVSEPAEKGTGSMSLDDFDVIVAAVREFVDREVIPREDEIEETDSVPAFLRDEAGKMGLFGYALPEAYGGLGFDMIEEVRLCFEVGRTSPAFRSLFGTNNGIAGQTIANYGTEDQKRRYLPELASGEAVGCFALSEAEAGSDPGGMRTRAERDGDDYVINGSKRFITNAELSTVFVVFARTDPDGVGSKGISAFLVDAGVPGLSLGPHDRKMGQQGAWTSEVFFDDVRVPASALIGGEEETGFSAAMRSLAKGRLTIAACCVGMAERIVDGATAYAVENRQGGTPIGDFQLVQALLAESETEARAGRALVLESARRYESGEDTRQGPAVAKLFCARMVNEVADRGVQVLGGMGYMRGVPIERFYRDARLYRIYEGTDEIQKLVIARAMLAAARAKASG